VKSHYDRGKIKQRTIEDLQAQGAFGSSCGQACGAFDGKL